MHFLSMLAPAALGRYTADAGSNSRMLKLHMTDGAYLQLGCSTLPGLGGQHAGKG